MDLGDSLDLPYQDNPPGDMPNMPDMHEARLSGGVVIAAAVVPLDDTYKPVLVFRFAQPDGQFYPPMILVLDDNQAMKLPSLVADAVTSAIRAADQHLFGPTE